MDLRNLAATLQNTYNPEERARKQAEAALAQMERTAGFQASLLQIITVADIPIPIRQAAIVRLKNIIRESWSVKSGPTMKISDADRKVLKDNMVEAIIQQPIELIRSQLLESCYWIIKSDFPEQWTDLMPVVMKNFRSGDQKRIYGALCCLRLAFKKYQFISPDRRGLVLELVNSTFPLLLQLFQTIVKNTTAEAYEAMRQIIKSFYLATQLYVPPMVREHDVLRAWMTLFFDLITRVPPQDTAGVSPEALKMVGLWKCKKWVATIFIRFFSRFGRPTVVSGEYKAFATHFFNTYAKGCQEALIGILHYPSKGLPVTDRVMQLVYIFLTDALNHSVLYKVMQPQLRFLLLESVLPCLSLTQYDLALWSENPHEFVRKSLDVMEEFQDPRVAAQNFLIEMVKVRTRYSLKMVLEAVSSILTTYKNANPQQRNPILKEAALRMIGTLRKLLLSKADYQSSLEELVAVHVFPEFQSPLGYMRSRACWVVGQFAKLTYKKEENHAMAVQLVCGSLTDKELPVKLEAARAVSRIVRTEKVVKFITPHLSLILEQFFVLLDEIGNEEVVATLGDLIAQMGTDIAPYATHLCARLSTVWAKLYDTADEDDDETALTAMQCTRAVNSILYSLESLPNCYPQLEQICQPMILKMLDPKSIDMLDEVLEMVVCFTYFGPSITPFMWSLLPRIVACYHEWAADYISNMVAPLDNYISRGTEVFVSSQNPNYVQLIFSICSKLLSNAEMEVDSQYACKLLEAIFAHCKGRVDNILPDTIRLVANRLFESNNMSLKLLLCDVLGVACFYNPALFLQAAQLGGEEFFKKLFNHWLSHLEHMTKKRKHQKMSALGLISLTLLPPSSLPASLRDSFHQVLAEVVKMLLDAAKEDSEHQDEDEGDDEEQAEFADIGEDEDALAEIEELAKFTQKVQDGLNKFEEEVDAENYASPIDDVDEFIFFAQCLDHVSKDKNGFVQRWMASLPGPQKDQVQSLVAEGAKRKQELDNPKPQKQ